MRRHSHGCRSAHVVAQLVGVLGLKLGAVVAVAASAAAAVHPHKGPHLALAVPAVALVAAVGSTTADLRGTGFLVAACAHVKGAVGAAVACLAAHACDRQEWRGERGKAKMASNSRPSVVFIVLYARCVCQTCMPGIRSCLPFCS